MPGGITAALTLKRPGSASAAPDKCANATELRYASPAVSASDERSGNAHSRGDGTSETVAAGQIEAPYREGHARGDRGPAAISGAHHGAGGGCRHQHRESPDHQYGAAGHP